MSRLNTPPACAPVNASLPALRPQAHDSEPVWLARPSPYGSFIHTSTPVYPGAPMITCANSLCRERDAQPSGRCLLHTMSDTELSRVRTELHRRRILAAVSPHPVQADSQPAPHGDLGDALVPTHRQVEVPTSPVRMAPHRCLRRLHQQEAQQRVALLADV